MPLRGIARARRAGLLQKYYPPVAIILALTLVVSAVNALEPLVLKVLFDDLQRGGTIRILLLAVAAIAAIGVVRELLSGVANWMTWRTRLRLQQQLLDIVVGRLHRLPLAFYRSEGVGAIMTRLDRGITGAVDAVTQLAFNVIPSVVFLIISVIIMFRLDVRLALLVILMAPLPPLISAFAAPTQTARERQLLDRWMKIYSRFNEVLSGIVTVKSFVREEEEKRRFISDVGAANSVVISGVRYDAAVSATQNFTVTLARIAALGLGGALALRGEITVGTLVAFLNYVGSVFAPVQGLSGIYRTFRTARVSVDSVYDILDVQDSLGDAPGAVDLGRVEGEVDFEDIHFGYQEQRELLHGIDLHVRPGESVALVGPSGAGKSTLMSLLQRFYDPTSGRILIDGLDIRFVKQAALRHNIGVVLQESLLFDDTVAANIAYGRPDATPAEIEAAARAAHVDIFIKDLPDGYSTRVGERGSRLSAGERQRVAIARVLLKNPPIVILDEATSALDAESEALVQEALERMLRDRTTFVIAHRLATVVNANRVCVLRDGRIVEMGTHAELMKANGYYASLVRRQTAGLLPG